jgi:hypothetical protein
VALGADASSAEHANASSPSAQTTRGCVSSPPHDPAAARLLDANSGAFADTPS